MTRPAKRSRFTSPTSLLLIAGVSAFLCVAAGILAFSLFRGLSNAERQVDQENACQQTKQVVALAAARYHDTKGTYPTGSDSSARIKALVDSGYLAAQPKSGDFTITLSADGHVTADRC